MEPKEPIVISLGGSLIMPEAIDTAYLKAFQTTILEYIEKGFRFVIICGGGRICRIYNKAVEEIITPSKEDLDWLGIATTKLNAELIRLLFSKIAHHRVVLDPGIMPNSRKPVIVGGGWHPGNSSDLAAVVAALSIGAKKVVNLSDIDYAYDKDPKQFRDAKIIKQSTWPDFRALLPREWDPGLSSPFDPIAAEKAENFGIEVAIMNGRNIENFKKYLNGEEFIGTIIK